MKKRGPVYEGNAAAESIRQQNATNFAEFANKNLDGASKLI
jgi:hypothetical protein